MRKTLILSVFACMVLSPIGYAEVGGTVTRDVSVESKIEKIEVSEIETGKLMWSVEGHPQQGFKVVWSKNTMPEYPPRDGDKAVYIGENEARDAYINGFEGDGVYNVRVCEYLDGVCGTYSNEIQMSLIVKDGTEKFGFKDLSKDNPNYDAVKYLYEEKVIQGYEDGSFKAYNTINRAEFLKILMELSDYDISGGNCFSDVSDQWFAPYVCTAADLGVVEGYEDGSFKPERSINFAEASKIIVNTLALETDNSNAETWYHSYVSAMDLLSAIPTSVDSFDKDITRGEMSEMVYRIHSGKLDKESTNYYELKGELKYVNKDLGITFNYPKEWGKDVLVVEESAGWKMITNSINGIVFMVVTVPTEGGDRGGGWADGSAIIVENCLKVGANCNTYMSKNGLEFVERTYTDYFDSIAERPVTQFHIAHPSEDKYGVAISNIHGVNFLDDYSRKIDLDDQLYRDDLLVIVDSFDFL